MKRCAKILDIGVMTGFSIWGLSLNPLVAFISSLILFLGIYSFRAYDSDHMNSMNDTAIRVSVGTAFGFLMILVLHFIFNLHLNRFYFLEIFIFNLIILTLLHKAEYRFFEKNLPEKRYLVIGREKEIGTLLEEISSKTMKKLKFVEYINPSPDRLEELVNDGFETEKLNKIKSLVSFFVKENDSKFNAIIVTDPNLENLVKEQIESYKKDGIEVEYLPTIAEKYLKRIPMEVLERFPEYYSMIFESKNQNSPPKRLTDIFIGAILFALFSPFMLIIVIWTFIEDGRPIIFSQPRVGKNSEIFTLYKFRSLKILKEEKKSGETPNDKIEQRVLKIGKITRKTRLDESLQFLNVIKGNMSIVGSRPEMEDFHDEMKNKIPFYSYRLKLNPGITGWAQICYKHTTSLDDYKKKTEYDLYYIKNQNTMLDFQIMLKTVETMLGMKGAR